MDDLIRVRKHVPSGTVVLQRADKRNALSRWMMVQLKQAFEDLHQERKVRAVILTGAGSAFCSGIDLQEVQDSSHASDALDQWYRDAVQYKELLELMLVFPKPIIAAVNVLPWVPGRDSSGIRHRGRHAGSQVRLTGTASRSGLGDRGPRC
jgi:methylglutaconyl-CoA hydratase